MKQFMRIDNVVVCVQHILYVQLRTLDDGFCIDDLTIHFVNSSHTLSLTFQDSATAKLFFKKACSMMGVGVEE